MTTPISKTIAELFGIPSSMQIACRSEPPPKEAGAVRVDPDYVFRTDVVRDLAIFWTDPWERAAMMIGPKGSGKTTVVEQWHARTCTPLYVVNGHKRITQEELFGQYLPTDGGGLVWQDGPVLRAAREGASVLINELNAIESGITIALNDIAQAGSRVTNPVTGEVFDPAEGFRIFGTMNPVGRDAVQYQRQELDPSTRERFFWIEVGYPTETEEIAIVGKEFALMSDLGDGATMSMAKMMVELAGEVRATSVAANGRPDAIPETISTRVLRRWARYWARMYRRPGSAHESLRRALTASCEPAVAEAIHELVRLKFNVADPRAGGS